MIKHIYGSGKPAIAIVACMHGDETCGLAAFASLAGECIKGTVKCIIGNPGAVAANRRFLTKDLNRCFPGNIDGDYEDQQAAQIMNEIGDCDYVLDLHSRSQSLPFAIITKPTPAHLRVVRASCLGTAVLMSTHLKGGKALIDHHPCGISIECGTKGTAQCDGQAITCVTNALRSLGFLEGKSTPPPEMNIIEILARIRLPDDTFVPTNNIQDFVPVKPATLLGSSDQVRLTSKGEFIPVFFGEPDYYAEGVLGLVGRKVTWN